MSQAMKFYFLSAIGVMRCDHVDPQTGRVLENNKEGPNPD